MSDAEIDLEPYGSFEEWLADGQKLAEQLHRKLMLEFLNESIAQADAKNASDVTQLAIEPFCASLASALGDDTGIAYFESLSIEHKLRILHAAELSLMRLSMDMQKEVRERMAKSAG